MLALLGLLGVPVLLALGRLAETARPTQRPLVEVLLRFGVAVEAWGGFPRARWATGRLGGRRLSVRRVGAGVVLKLDAGLPPSLRVQIHFEEPTWGVIGADRRLGAALGCGELRAAARFGGQLAVEDGRLSLSLPNAGSAAAALAALAQLQDRLSPARPLLTLLEATAQEDFDPRARAEAIGPLLELRPELSEPLASDPAPDVRLAVARSVGGDRGFALAAEILTSEIFRPDLQQAALRLLLSRYGADRVGPVLRGAVAAADDELLAALITAMTELGQVEAADVLESALPTAGHANAARIAEALGRLAGPRAEPALIELLERIPASGPDLPEEEDLVIAVADALGRVGAGPAVGPLRRLARQGRLDDRVGVAVAVALDLIRARHGGLGTVGALALAPDPDGRLGLA